MDRNEPGLPESCAVEGPGERPRVRITVRVEVALSASVPPLLFSKHLVWEGRRWFLSGSGPRVRYGWIYRGLSQYPRPDTTI